MRRLALLVAGFAVVGCPRKSHDETAHVAPDPVVASASASASSKPAPTAEPFAAKESPIVLAHGDDVAWIDVDGRVGHTSDGGAHWTWTTLPKPYSFETITLARGDGSAWATLSDEDAKTTKHYRCDGATWTDVTPKLPSMPTGDFYGTVDAFDRDVAYVARSDESTPTKMPFLATHDGGKTWTRMDVSTFVYVRDARFYPVDRDRVWAMGEIDHGMSSMPGLLWLSDDGGLVGWKVVAPPPPNAGGLLFLDHARGFLLATTTTTTPPNLWRTEDEGASWKKIFDESEEIEAMPIFDGDAAVLVAKRFQSTSDGGKTWKKGSPRPEGAIGQLGSKLWHVNDGHFENSTGTTWKMRTEPQPLLVGEVMSIVVASERTGWVVVQTQAGTWRVVGTHDGGGSWTAFTPRGE